MLTDKDIDEIERDSHEQYAVDIDNLGELVYGAPEFDIYHFARAIEAKVRAEYEPRFKVGNVAYSKRTCTSNRIEGIYLMYVLAGGDLCFEDDLEEESE